MNHNLCITKAFNDAVNIYRKYWKPCLLFGAIIGAFWLIETSICSKMSYISTFCKYELPQSKHAVDFFNNVTSTVQYHLTFPYAYKDYAIFFILLMLLTYIQLGMSRFFIGLFTKKSPNFSDALISFGTFARAIAVYLFIVLMGIIFTTLGAILLKVGDWFLLTLEHKVLLLAIYGLLVVLPFFLSFSLIRWIAVDGSKSVSQIIDSCFALTQNNKLRIIIVFILMHVVSYIVQFCFLRLFYWPFTQFNILSYGVFIAIGLVAPLKEAVWTSVYQQLK